MDVPACMRAFITNSKNFSLFSFTVATRAFYTNLQHPNTHTDFSSRPLSKPARAPRHQTRTTFVNCATTPQKPDIDSYMIVTRRINHVLRSIAPATAMAASGATGTSRPRAVAWSNVATATWMLNTARVDVLGRY